MKKICAFITRNLQTTMVEKHRVIPSSSPFGISSKQTQKPMKRSTVIRKNKKNNKNTKHSRNRKHLFFDKIIAYLLSDSYMYNPLVSPQPTFDFPPPKQILTTLPPPGGQQDVALPVKGRNRKLIEKVVDFLEADCYLYSPLLIKHQVSSKNHPATPTSGHFRTLEETTNTETRPTVVTKTVDYRESVKHTIHQNCWSKPIQGS